MRKLAVLAALIALFTSLLSFTGSNTASACPIFTLPKLCFDEPPVDGYKAFIENIDW